MNADKHRSAELEPAAGEPGHEHVTHALLWRAGLWVNVPHATGEREPSALIGVYRRFNFSRLRVYAPLRFNPSICPPLNVAGRRLWRILAWHGVDRTDSALPLDAGPLDRGPAPLLPPPCTRGIRHLCSARATEVCDPETAAASRAAGAGAFDGHWLTSSYR